ncbi:hypothetical protein [Mycobacterium lepromatosis]|uniref:hypothetical protein n=1 Tax=Mycobacterium lepromatosis TaxID=480418 RepID=UPI0005F7F72E|nr:hypothetical protein [Mycobacterium lepromatosis]
MSIDRRTFVGIGDHQPAPILRVACGRCLHRPARVLEYDVVTGWVGSKRLRTNRVVTSSSSTDAMSTQSIPRPTA